MTAYQDVTSFIHVYAECHFLLYLNSDKLYKSVFCNVVFVIDMIPCDDFYICLVSFYFVHTDVFMTNLFYINMPTYFAQPLDCHRDLGVHKLTEIHCVLLQPKRLLSKRWLFN